MVPPSPTADRTSTSTGRFLDTHNLISFFLSSLNWIAPPETRRRFYSATFKFCYQRPVLSSFFAAQIFFAFVPLLCFVGFSICAVLFISAIALGAGVFWVGVAAAILFWTLVVTCAIATTAWLWVAICLWSVRWIARITGFIEVPPQESQASTPKPFGAKRPWSGQPGGPVGQNGIEEAGTERTDPTITHWGTTNLT
ncbi:hypothetical protein DRE_02967 [Drechslerella stenobrocha 248]|uniref:Uncharacterized protein n=1 Tax=Drechslerella stenobrocha 248 TaxID=1043628 RepID=W7I5M1_9PEZI|nr:hypothetical protein DRE_02967 [Drechslerella stenobrocha 248]